MGACRLVGEPPGPRGHVVDEEDSLLGGHRRLEIVGQRRECESVVADTPGPEEDRELCLVVLRGDRALQDPVDSDGCGCVVAAVAVLVVVVRARLHAGEGAEDHAVRILDDRGERPVGDGIRITRDERRPELPGPHGGLWDQICGRARRGDRASRHRWLRGVRGSPSRATASRKAQDGHTEARVPRLTTRHDPLLLTLRRGLPIGRGSATVATRQHATPLGPPARCHVCCSVTTE